MVLRPPHRVASSSSRRVVYDVGFIRIPWYWFLSVLFVFHLMMILPAISSSSLDVSERDKLINILVSECSGTGALDVGKYQPGSPRNGNEEQVHQQDNLNTGVKKLLFHDGPSVSLNHLIWLFGSDRGHFGSGYGDHYDVLFQRAVRVRRDEENHVRAGASFVPYRCLVRVVLEVGLGTIVKAENSSMEWWRRGARAEYTPGVALAVWRAYFPNALIVGLDVSADAVARTNELYAHDDRVVAVRASSFDREGVRQAMESVLPLLVRSSESSPRSIGASEYGVVPKFDVIFEDGLHSLGAQISTLCTLYEYLSPEQGVYLMEDVDGKDARAIAMALRRFFFRRSVRMQVVAAGLKSNQGVISIVKDSAHNAPRLRFGLEYFDRLFSVNAEEDADGKGGSVDHHLEEISKADRRFLRQRFWFPLVEFWQEWFGSSGEDTTWKAEFRRTMMESENMSSFRAPNTTTWWSHVTGWWGQLAVEGEDFEENNEEPRGRY